MSLFSVPVEIFDHITCHLVWNDLLQLRLSSAAANNALFNVLDTRAATFSKLLDAHLEKSPFTFLSDYAAMMSITARMMTAGGRTFSHVCALSYNPASSTLRQMVNSFQWERLTKWLDKHRLYTNIVVVRPPSIPGMHGVT